MVFFPTYSSTWVNSEKAWMSEAGEIDGNGVQTSRTLDPSRSTDVSLRLMILWDIAVRLHKGAMVAELQMVAVVESATSLRKEEW